MTTAQRKKTNVLIVDDDIGMLESLVDIMTASDYVVEGVSSGEEALAKAPEFQPHWIVMDVRMPGLNGVETFRRLKPLLPRCAVVLMTANSSGDLLEEANAEGVFAVLSKPLDLAKLLSMMAEDADG